MTTWQILLTCVACGVAGVVGGVLGGMAIAARIQRESSSALYQRLYAAFQPHSLACLTVTERQFPARIRADLQRALDDYFREETSDVHQCGIRLENEMNGVELPYLLTAGSTVWEVPLQNEEVSIGDGQIVHCPRNAFWIARHGNERLAALISKPFTLMEPPRVKFQVATTNTEQGVQIARDLFQRLETAVQQAASYRGKVLSLDTTDSYTGEGTGIKVHAMAPVHRDDVILPAETLRLVERNVLEFVGHRKRLLALGQSTKKGLLFHGPPGNGKTYTIRYLIGALPGHTKLLVTGAQLGRLSEYIALARLLQPSLVLIEDVDLVAKEKTQIGTSCEEPLLNQLLNEMDGLTSESEIIFVLTTNRPQLLEEALAARPGRIDQAIEFGRPQIGERARLVRLYSPGVTITEDTVQEIARTTDGASAAFIKELMRRAIQFHWKRSDEAVIDIQDIRQALDELVLNRSSLNARILGYSSTAEHENSGPHSRRDN